MSRIDRVEIHAFAYEVPNLGLPAHGAAGVGNWVHRQGSNLKASRYAVRIRTDDGLAGEYVTHWVGTPAAMAQSLMLAPHLLGRDPEAREQIYDDLKRELSSVRTGRANLHLLDGVRVDYYGTSTPLSQVATLSVPEARLIVVKPWEKNMIPPIEKAIRDANLGLNPQSDKDLVRVPIPPLTEERRRDIVKQVKVKGEDHKVAIRNERRDAKELISVAEKDGDIAADEAKKAMDKMQKATDDGVKKVDEIVAAKEKEVMQV